MLATAQVKRCRAHVLRFFNAPPDDYAVVFTANASHALKLVGEAYPFEPGDRLLLTFDNHNSVNGIREFDRAHGAETTYLPVTPPDLRVDEARLDRALDRAGTARHKLFAYPAQSNFSGVQHPLEWVARAQARGWDVLADAAAFVPTNRLDLSRVRPDYVALSFLQDVRASDRRRGARRPAPGAPQAAPTVVLGGHDHGGVGAGRPPLPRRGVGRL